MEPKVERDFLQGLLNRMRVGMSIKEIPGVEDKLEHIAGSSTAASCFGRQQVSTGGDSSKGEDDGKDMSKGKDKGKGQ
jgi:hypothetical protein